MKIARMRHTVYIQTPTVTRNARGAESVTWADSPLLRAEVRTPSGDERRADEQMIALASHQATLRWPLPAGTTITTKKRLRWAVEGGSRYLAITFVGEPDNLRRRIEVWCQELVGEDRAE